MRYADIPKLATWKNDTSVLRKSAGGTLLQKIDAEIENYHKAFAPMTKRNLLTDLGYFIRDWEKIHYATVSNHPNVVGLKEVIARKLKELGPTTFKYRRATCIGFNIGCNTNTNQYFRFTPNDAGDMRGKCSEMMHAIQAAQSAVLASGDDDETLKIFMAPEFYFRGAKGAYSYGLVSEIIPTMQGLGTNKALFQHWLFVYGTAIGAHEDNVTYCTLCNPPLTVKFDRDTTSRVDSKGIHKKTKGVCKNDPSHPLAEGAFGAEVQNVALIQKGADTHMVVKEYVSGIDYIGNQVTVTQGTKKNPINKTLNVVGPSGSNQSRIVSKFQDERMGGGIFTFDGITFGMEICLDHILSTTPGGVGRLAAYANSIQILLIPSFGMEIRSNLYCTNGGIIFNVDGRGSGSSEVVVKGSMGPLAHTPPAAAAKTGGRIEIWGPFAIPRHA